MIWYHRTDPRRSLGSNEEQDPKIWTTNRDEAPDFYEREKYRGEEVEYKVVGIYKRTLPNGKFSYYLEVEQKLDINGNVEKIMINPMSIPEDLDRSKSKVGDIVKIFDTRLNEKQQHAMACSCTKCIGSYNELANLIMEKSKKEPVIIIDTKNASGYEKLEG